MKKEVKKLYNGCIDVRDYELKKCIENSENVEVLHEGKKMTIPYHEISNKATGKSKLFKSKTGGQDYHLISYKWIPDETIEN
jgi:hypothetical protein